MKGCGTIELRPHLQKNPAQWEGGVSRGQCLYEDVWRFDPTCEYRISENYLRMRLSIQVAVQPSLDSSPWNVLALSELV
jgi:hypothetical protein